MVRRAVLQSVVAAFSSGLLAADGAPKRRSYDSTAGSTFIEVFFGAAENGVSAEAMNWWTRMMVDRCWIKVMLDLYQVMTETDFRPELRGIKTPTLILQGDKDKSTRLELTGRRTHELISTSRLVVYEGAAHGLPFTHGERMVGDIVEFAGALPCGPRS